mgnify:CR=1 FL=1
MESILNYFQNLSIKQKKQYKSLLPLYNDWNNKINVISRKDMNEFYIHHVLHSLGISKIISFNPGTQILDIGTGGGFPGIPLAILFPEVHFDLLDSIGKKINVVKEVSQALKLKNVSIHHIRAENYTKKADFIISRAVTKMETFVPWIKNKILPTSNNIIKNGILSLKGGDLTEELRLFPEAEIYYLNNYFHESFFETKKIVHLPI